MIRILLIEGYRKAIEVYILIVEVEVQKKPFLRKGKAFGFYYNEVLIKI
jgi:hypothetical protein